MKTPFPLSELYCPSHCGDEYEASMRFELTAIPGGLTCTE